MQAQLDKAQGQLSRVQKEKENVQQEMERYREKNDKNQARSVYSVLCVPLFFQTRAPLVAFLRVAAVRPLFDEPRRLPASR